MGKIDDPQNAIDHRIPDRDEAVDRTERQPVDELLHKYFHPGTTPPKPPMKAGRLLL
mgnify:CR=1 FL=1